MRALILLVTVIASCAVDAARPDLPHPTIDEFRAHISYPYVAPAPRRQQLERAARLLRPGMSESEVLRLAGQPDYKAPQFTPDRKGELMHVAEIWYYVHTWEHEITPGYIGRMLILGLDVCCTPRKLIQIDKNGL